MHDEKRTFLSLWAAALAARGLTLGLGVLAARHGDIAGASDVQGLWKVVTLITKLVIVYANARWTWALNPSRRWVAVPIGAASLIGCVDVAIGGFLCTYRAPPTRSERDEYEDLLEEEPKHRREP